MELLQQVEINNLNSMIEKLMCRGRGTPSRQLNWVIEVDIASLATLSLEDKRMERMMGSPGPASARKFSRQTMEQDDADIQRALRKKSRKVIFDT